MNLDAKGPSLESPTLESPTLESRDGATRRVTVETVSRIDQEIREAFARLIPQLSSSARVPSESELQAIAAGPATSLLVARSRETREILGTLTLVVFPIPTGTRALIEDVVVDDQASGRGVGTALVRAALEQARQARARTVDLTSRPERERANRLYARTGFVRRDTNLWRVTF